MSTEAAHDTDTDAAAALRNPGGNIIAARCKVRMDAASDLTISTKPVGVARLNTFLKFSVQLFDPVAATVAACANQTILFQILDVFHLTMLTSLLLAQLTF